MGVNTGTSVGGFHFLNSFSMRQRGPSLRELASLFQRLGAYYAINMDGGGSTVMVENGVVISRPRDTFFRIVERPVASVICLKPIQSPTLIAMTT